MNPLEAFRKKSILVIDDEEIVRKSCTRVLSPAGYEVDTAGDGLQGLTLMKDKKYDLVVTDLMMPRMDGVELMENIRLTAPDAKVIFITGYATTGALESVLNSGAMMCLEKPFGPEDILKAVSEALSH